MMQQDVVIIGGGQAGAQAIISLKSLGHVGRITLIGDEPHLPYYRPPLSKDYLAGKIDAARLLLKPSSFYDKHAVDRHLGTRAVRIDRTAKEVEVASGQRIRYDQLLLATGMRARRLDVPGGNLEDIHYLRTLEDVDGLGAAFARITDVAVVGGGYVGLEFAAVAAAAGKTVTVIEAQDRLLPRVASPPFSRFIRALHEQHGVRIMTGAAVKEFGGRTHVETVTLADGRKVPAQLVVVGIGGLANIELAVEAGLATRRGIVVDREGRTNDRAIFAAGDCTEQDHRLCPHPIQLESVQNAIEQGKVAAAAILGAAHRADDVPWFWSDQYDCKLQMAGLPHRADRMIVRRRADGAALSVFHLHADRLVAVETANSPRDFITSRKLIGEGGAVAADQLGDPEFVEEQPE